MNGSKTVVYHVQVWYGPHCGWSVIERARVMNPSIRGIHEQAARRPRASAANRACACADLPRAHEFTVPSGNTPHCLFLQALFVILDKNIKLIMEGGRIHPLG